MYLKKISLFIFIFFVSLFLFNVARSVVYDNLEIRTLIVEKVLEQKGKEYIYGSHGPSTWDCSSLINYAYQEAKVKEFWGPFKSHGPTAAIQFKMGEAIKINELLPGDLLFETKVNSDEIGHVGMYIGNDKTIEAAYLPKIVNSVIIYPLSRWTNSKNFAGARRVKEEYWPDEDVLDEKKETAEDKSFFNKIKSFFKNEGGETVQTEGEQTIGAQNEESNKPDIPEQVEEQPDPTEIYDLAFQNTPQSITIQAGEEVKLTVEVKNTGTIDWQGENISANVVGGRSDNTLYQHSSWLTQLRPTLLDQIELPSGEIGSFSFVINTPVKAGDYEFGIQAVQVDNGFSYIPGGFWTLQLTVEEELIEEVEKETKKTVVEKTKEVVKEIVEEVKEVIEEIKKVVKKVYYGGGGSSPASPPEPEEEEVELPEISLTTTSTVTNTTSTIVEGTKNEATTVVYSNVTSTMSYPSSTTWQTEIELSEGENILEFYGANDNGDETATTSLTITLDTIAPDVPTVTVIQNEFATPTLYISWSSSDSGIRDYDVEYNSGGEWLVIATSTTSTDQTMAATRLSTYSF